MTDLSNTIIDTYDQRFHELDDAHKFHWLSRLSQWSGSHTAELSKLVSVTRPADPAGALRTALSTQPDPIEMNHYAERQPFLAAYPQLFGLELALFLVRHWLIHYELDARDTLLELVSLTDIELMINKLSEDTAALATLSTYAVNVIYLAKRLLLHEASFAITLDTFRNVKLYTSPTLCSYFATHCVIGDSLFYAQPVAEEHHPSYKAMLADVEPLLNELTIDAQLEFVVAARLCAYESPSLRTIIANAEAHFDSDQGYIVDPRKPHKNSLNGAEHRNVLYVMATTPSALLHAS